MLTFLHPPFSSQTASDREQFATWLESEQGKQLLDAEVGELERLLPSLVGDYALQVGVRSEPDLLKSGRFPRRWCFSSCDKKNADLLMSPANMPLANHCQDLVLLHHCLDFDDAPYRILSEAQRILKPGGTLLVVGFNPFSLLGLQRLFHRHDQPPWSGRFLRAGRVGDLAGMCGCQPLGYASGYYSRHLFPLFDRLGRHFWQRLGGFYIMLAKKQAIPMRPLLSRRQLLKDLPPNVISVPAARWQAYEEHT